MTGKAKVKRAFASHVPKWQRFQTSLVLSSDKTSETDLSNNVYQRQYSHVYANRLNELKPRCWNNVPDLCLKRCERILDLEEDISNVVVGTLIKEIGNGEPFESSKCTPNDVLVLEDESGRVYLETEMVDNFATGSVVAVQGFIKPGGLLHVEAIYHPKPLDLPEIEGECIPSSNGDAPHIMLLSGLNCGDPNASSMQRDMLLAYLQGHLTTTASKVSRIVIAGNSVWPQDPAFGAMELDIFLALVCSSGVPIDIIPGMDDPTTANWPQRPLHSSLLRESGAFGKDYLTKGPNPYACAMGEKFILGTDGRNVSDLRQYLRCGDSPISEVDALARTLQLGHICPTGPDSVPTIPHRYTDPMILPHKPHIYFAGNCLGFATKVVESTRLICIPKFSTTGIAVLVNLETLGCELLRFDDAC